MIRKLKTAVEGLWEDDGARWFLYTGILVLVFCMGLYLGGLIMGRQINAALGVIPK